MVLIIDLIHVNSFFLHTILFLFQFDVLIIIFLIVYFFLLIYFCLQRFLWITTQIQFLAALNYKLNLHNNLLSLIFECTNIIHLNVKIFVLAILIKTYGLRVPNSLRSYLSIHYSKMSLLFLKKSIPQPIFSLLLLYLAIQQSLSFNLTHTI